MPSPPSLSRDVLSNQEEDGQFRVEGIQDGAEPICLEKFGNKYDHSLQCLGEASQANPKLEATHPDLEHVA